MSKTDKGVIGVCLFVAVFSLGCIFQIFVQESHWKKEAVKHNAAEYVLDGKTGDVTWRWK